MTVTAHCAGRQCVEVWDEARYSKGTCGKKSPRKRVLEEYKQMQ